MKWGNLPTQMISDKRSRRVLEVLGATKIQDNIILQNLKHENAKAENFAKNLPANSAATLKKIII